MDILITGGTGGIGHAMVERLSQLEAVNVHALWHHSPPPELSSRVQWHRADITNEKDIIELARKLERVDWIMNTAGKLHSETIQPEKNLQQFEAAAFEEMIRVNTLPTLLLAKHFTHALKRSPSPRLAVLSARVGSISDNRLGGWYSYRCAKAALNMAVKSISIEWQRTMPNSCVVALHPGTTDTPLSKPFQHNVPAGKLFPPHRVASDLIKIIESLTPAQTGQFLAYDGSVIDW
ncbi:SDR family oxidoreductase [Photobacterium halotolerans]|uniref:C factor cell-cell signaling protein n=1 Tax=Photobacterium halotolerans TaxID=265726 RepID=A0A0F5VHF9_9GAMM|nr:SDR family oxidoreductase [Photobacterium halotolerans]KKD00930.1 C factor cell-cell signaling protein [Photobacterium halotolerans]